MKLSKTGLITIVACVLVIAIASLAIVHFKQFQQQKLLQEQLAQLQTNLGQAQTTGLVSDRTELETQLDEATSRLEIVQSMLSRPIESSVVTRSLFDLAENHGLEVTEMTYSIPSQGALAGVEFSLISLTARVEGDAADIIGFVIDLNNNFSTSIIETVTITVPDTTNGEEATADIRMVIYTYQEG